MTERICTKPHCEQPTFVVHSGQGFVVYRCEINGHDERIPPGCPPARKSAAERNLDRSEAGCIKPGCERRARQGYQTCRRHPSYKPKNRQMVEA